MKKTYYLFAIVALMAFVVMPVIIRAEITSTSTKKSLTEKASEEMLSKFNEKQKNAKANQNVRNNTLETMASSTRAMMNGTTTRPWNASSTMMRNGSTTPEMMKRYASTTWATSTMPFRGPNGEDRNPNKDNNWRGQFGEDIRGYINNGRAMMLNMFNLRKHNIAKELQKALGNLTNVRTRLQARIEKATASGRDMTKARAALVIADGKIATAQSAVNAILNLSATTTTTTVASSTASSTDKAIDLNKPRLVAMGAQKAIKDAQKALNDVIVAIAHDMGLKLGNGQRPASTTATSTATTTATTTNTNATSTATTTP